MPAKPSTNPSFQLFTDGACLGNPGPGGWAAILRDAETGKEELFSGGDSETTNNRMELFAVIEGLRAIESGSKVTLVGDSEYVLKGIDEWLAGWKARNWRKSDKKPVMNSDLWKQLDELLQKHTVTVEWIRGHTGHKENEECDRIAKLKAKEYAA